MTYKLLQSDSGVQRAFPVDRKTRGEFMAVERALNNVRALLAIPQASARISVDGVLSQTDLRFVQGTIDSLSDEQIESVVAMAGRPATVKSLADNARRMAVALMSVVGGAPDFSVPPAKSRSRRAGVVIGFLTVATIGVIAAAN